MVKKTYFFFLLAFLLGMTAAFGQSTKVVQFSGLVVTGDSLKAVPFASVSIQNKQLGTITDYYGYFSFVAEPGDSILFSSVGYKNQVYVIPDSMVENRYAMVHILTRDTIQLAETVVYPWPSREQFKDAFFNADIPDDAITIAQKNLDPETMKELRNITPMSGSANFKFQMSARNEKLYYNGQTPPIQLFNPFAWAQFFEAWQNGDFKRDKNK